MIEERDCNPAWGFGKVPAAPMGVKSGTSLGLRPIQSEPSTRESPDSSRRNWMHPVDLPLLHWLRLSDLQPARFLYCSRSVLWTGRTEEHRRCIRLLPADL